MINFQVSCGQKSTARQKVDVEKVGTEGYRGLTVAGAATQVDILLQSARAAL